MWYLALILMAVLALGFVFVAWRQQQTVLSTLQANKAVYQSRLVELEEDFAQQLLSEKDLQEAQRELEKTFVTDIHDPDEQVKNKAANSVLIAVLLLVIAGGMYLWDGSWQQQRHADLAFKNLETISEHILSGQATEVTEADMINFSLGLRQKLQEKPDAGAWSLYGRVMLQMGSLEEAVAAFERSRRLEPNHIDNLVLYAQTLIALGSDGELAQASGYLRQVLERDKTNLEAIFLLGVVAYERGDYDRAVQAWEISARLVDENDERYAVIESALEDAKARSEGRVLTVTVQVSISEVLRNELPPGAHLFVFIRDPDGGPAPIAVVRQRVSDFPMTVTLTDADAVMTDQGISAVKQWLVGARLTQSGTIEMQVGDMEARPVLVEAEAGKRVELRITEMRQ